MAERLYNRGEDHGNSTLTTADVVKIRTSDLSDGKLAQEFDVSRQAVRLARLGLTWTHLKEPPPIVRTTGPKDGSAVLALLRAVGELEAAGVPATVRILSNRMDVAFTAVEGRARRALRLEWLVSPGARGLGGYTLSAKGRAQLTDADAGRSA